MKRLSAIFSIIFFWFSFQANAQLKFSETNNGGTMLITDINGKSLLNAKYDPDIEGIPFIVKDWSDADLLTRSDKIFRKIKVKMNMESNEVYYQDSAGATMVSEPGNIIKVSFTKLISKENIPYVFKCGYPAIDKQNGNYYYQLLAEGKVELLKKTDKTIQTFKNDMSGDKRKEFVEGEIKYYLFSGGTLEEVKNDKTLLLDMMNDQRSAVEEYVKVNKINFRKISDLLKLVSYYNGLK